MIQPKYIVISTLAAGLLVLAGCITQTATDTTVNTAHGNTNANTTTEQGSEIDLSTGASAKVDTSDWLTYTSEEYGFGFRYPKGWGEIQINKEAGCLGSNTLKTDQDSCEHVTLSLPKFGDSALFLTTQSVLYTQYAPGRGGYWGDNSSQIKNQEFVTNYCIGKSESECKVYTNSNGIVIARSLEDMGFDQSKATMYYIKSPHPVYFGIVLSTDRLRNINLENVELQLEQLVDSFYFL